MNEKDSDIQGNKISRLQFLRLLGAGAIGYFAYRAGFINNLFGNATATAAIAAGGRGNGTSQRYAAGSVSSLSAATRLDEDGILMMATSNQVDIHTDLTQRKTQLMI